MFGVRFAPHSRSADTYRAAKLRRPPPGPLARPRGPFRLSRGHAPKHAVLRTSVSSLVEIRASEQVPQRSPPEQRPPAPTAVLRPVVLQVAALVPRCEVPARVVGRVVVPMRRRQDDSGGAQADRQVRERRRSSKAPARPVAPGADLGVPPPPVPEMVDQAPMRPAATLTGAASAPEPDLARELRPVEGIEVAVLGPDRHSATLKVGQVSREA